MSERKVKIILYALVLWSVIATIGLIIFNPFLLEYPYTRVRLAKILLFFLGITKQISYERRDYESVDEKSLS